MTIGSGQWAAVVAQFEYLGDFQPPMNPWHDDVMPKRSGKKRDFMQIARETVEKAIGERMDGTPLKVPVDRRNPHAVALGSLGGKKGGKARAKKLSPRQRRKIAKLAASARWSEK